MLASFIVSATHPLLDWTNNYGIRFFLPWSQKWSYGDLVFIVDPYLVAGSRRRGVPVDRENESF